VSPSRARRPGRAADEDRSAPTRRAAEARKPAKSLHRMLSTTGNPTMSNLSAIFAALQRSLRLDVRTEVVRLQ
jgi:hypothetical protein